jgi:hemerythrin
MADMAEQFEWKAEYCIDGGVIDEEHKKLLSLANAVLEIIDPARQFDDIKHVVQELYAYMGYHFDDEEALMQRCGFPGYERHVELHRSLIVKTNGILRGAHDLHEFGIRLQDFMHDWVLRHIAKEDSQIREYAQQAGLAMTLPPA